MGTREFKTGGCWLYTSEVSVSSAWVVEFVCCLTLLFLAFGVGLDPRQKMVIGEWALLYFYSFSEADILPFLFFPLEDVLSCALGIC